MTEKGEKEAPTESNGQESENVAAADETELETAIIRQVEYYFGDMNLPRDKFLREQIKLDDGWVPLEILTRFQRLAKLTTDLDVIANAIGKSTSGLLEVSDDNKKVRRHPEMPIPEMNEDRRKEVMSRTIYAKGFPKDSTLDDLLKFFNKFEEVENVVMRKYQERSSKKRLFKGSVFTTFKTREQAEKFVANKELKYNDTELLVHWQEDYIQLKQEEYAAKKETKEKKIKEKEKNLEQEIKEDFKLPTGAVFRFTEGSEKMSREDVKEALTALGAEIAFIDFKLGDKEGWVRLSKEDSAKPIAEKMPEGKLKIGEAEVVFQILEGEEEKTYLEKTVGEMAKRRRSNKNFKFNKGKNFRGKPGRKRRQDQNDDTPSKKVKAS